MHTLRKHVRRITLVLLLLTSLLISGCATVQYYGQAVAGHYRLLVARRPLAEVIRDVNAPPDVRAKLEAARAARRFASDALGLPDNASYTTYVALEKPYVVWNVFAAPPLSLTPRESCFLFVGCLQYRGYFSIEAAQRDAQARRADGDDVYVGGVAAYSTLGWFADPLLSSMLRWNIEELVKTLFHELAHQRLYVPDDTAFNESFATAVADAGYARWRATRGAPKGNAELGDAAFVALVMRHRDALAALYASPLADADKLARKATLLADLQAEFARERHRYKNARDYAAWLTQDLNNAKLASINAYHTHVPAFMAILRLVKQDLPRFYRAAELLTQAPKAARETCLGDFAADRWPAECLRFLGISPLTPQDVTVAAQKRTSP